jgi:hypothetical protein|tara:strand:+ start:817 stop:978 length:162 start_codon:yes stop_codon:yes gene_type:complete
MTKKKILKFETKKEGKLNTISRAIPVTTDKKTTLLPILTLSSFIKKKGKKDGE